MTGHGVRRFGGLTRISLAARLAVSVEDIVGMRALGVGLRDWGRELAVVSYQLSERASANAGTSSPSTGSGSE